MVLLTAPYYRQQEQGDGQPWPEDDPARVDRYNALLRQVAAASGGRVVVADVNAKLDPDGRFTTTVDGQVVRFADGIHVTPAGAKLISPWLLTAGRRARDGQPGGTGCPDRHHGRRRGLIRPQPAAATGRSWWSVTMTAMSPTRPT